MAGCGALLVVVAPGTPGAGGRRQRGGGGPPTTDPRTITDFEEITAIPFVFARHPLYPEAHVHMNSIYSDAFLDMVDPFVVTDPPRRATLVADPVLQLSKLRCGMNLSFRMPLIQQMQHLLPFYGQDVPSRSLPAIDMLIDILHQQL